jgi:hypothetical protein
VNEKAINRLAKNYNTLDYSVKLIELLKNIYPYQDFENLPKYELHRLLNETMFENYNGEQVLKYKLFQKYSTKRNIVAAFEIKVNNSRADFLTINGHTTSFEIKSELDNLSKLSKQAADYMLAFEYNYLIIDECHILKAKELVPESFGLWSYKNGKYIKLKKAELNTKMDPEVQLGLLSKRELVLNFPEVGGSVQEILISCNADLINRQFKKILKDRYRYRWDFLIANEADIFPIDLQFFFNTNVKPSNVYYH